MHHPVLRYRQVHLDFHTSPDIEGIGSRFDKQQWQEALKTGHVNSITCFAKCHHGWSYHPTQVGKQHPHLKFDLLRAQFDACKELDINVPIYLSAGFDDVAEEAHPQWRRIDHHGQYAVRPEIAEPGFSLMCFNSPYLAYLCDQIREVVELFPNADGIFLDIINPTPCCCKSCMKVMAEHDLDVRVEADRATCAQLALKRYYRQTTEACLSGRDDMPVFHNSGHIQRGNYEILKYQSHLELESLPTGGWGYDHFPLSAAYCRKLASHDFLGMTGKFHTTWGEFGGYKHPNALQYECAAMLAMGAKCSIGDQLHPTGEMDLTTYQSIGSAYAQVEQKEPWCVGAKHVADIGLLSVDAMRPGARHRHNHGSASDTGAGRILLEGHFLFDVLDGEMDFSPYRMLVLPDVIVIDDALKAKLDAYLAQGGRLFLTGESGLNPAKDRFVFEMGANWSGPREYEPDYILPIAGLKSEFLSSPMVMYVRAQSIQATEGQSLGEVYNPYFNRTYKHFCSHQHTPYRMEPAADVCGVHHGAILYLAHPVFTQYAQYGAVVYKDYVVSALRRLLGTPTVQTNMPSTARLSMTYQASENRSVIHLLYANTISRGGALSLSGGSVQGNTAIEVIESLGTLRDVEVVVQSDKPVVGVTLEPQGQTIAFEVENQEVRLCVPELTCHQMVVLQHEPSKYTPHN